MMERNIEEILNHAFIEAGKAHFEFFTTEHILLALCKKDGDTRQTLAEFGVDLNKIIEETKEYIEGNVPKLKTEDSVCMPTAAFHRVVENALLVAKKVKEPLSTGLHLLLSIMDETDSYAAYFLEKHHVDKTKLQNAVNRIAQKYDEALINEENTDSNALSSYCTNLNELAKAGHIDPLIGRENEIERTIQVLCRRRKNNPILVGEAGVGKTAIAEGLAKRIVDGETPEVLADATIYSVDLGAMVAGSKYRGDFEKRVKDLINALKKSPNAIIFIDEIHMLMGAGSTSDSRVDASNLLKPSLSSGELRCIGATTYKEFKNSFETNQALARRFQKIDIKEPSKSETVEILRGLLPQFESFHKVKYAPSTIEHAVDLADKYIHDRHLPDKAIDLIDEAGAKARAQTPPKQRINDKDIEHVLAKITQMPERTISANDKQLLKQLESRLKKRVFGQDKAIKALSSAIKLSRAGLKDIEKPIGAFLFTGPTGVGKTEVSRCLAEEMGMTFLRFDMSEYMEAHSVARLIGAPPGYVGHEDGGLLTEAISRTPHCVLLLDEIEKAHPDIFNLLLQIMDYGSLTDSNGKQVNFSNVVLIMTSNAGAAVLEKNPMGFTSSVAATNTQDTENALKRVFTPEFRNRLSEVITFAPLSKPVVSKIIAKLIDHLGEQLTPQSIDIKIQKTAKDWLLTNGYNPLMGARPMSRLVDKTIKQPLAEKILFGDLKNGGEVSVKYERGKEVLTIDSKPPKKTTKATKNTGKGKGQRKTPASA